MAQAQTGRRYRPTEEVDFVIVGSGAAGGILAKELATAGFSVVVLEQGPRLADNAIDHDEFGTFVLRNRTNNPATQPHTFRATARDRAARAWALIYGRHVGGSNAHFTGNFWRMRPSDFNEASRIGGVPGTGLADWPIIHSPARWPSTRKPTTAGRRASTAASAGSSSASFARSRRRS